MFVECDALLDSARILKPVQFQLVTNDVVFFLQTNAVSGHANPVGHTTQAASAKCAGQNLRRRLNLDEKAGQEERTVVDFVPFWNEFSERFESTGQAI